MLSKRKHIRLKAYDYSRCGGCFVTVCVLNKSNVLGEIINGDMRLNDCGNIVKEEWLRMADLRQHVSCGEFIIMPNHLHGIILIYSSSGIDRATQRVAPTKLLSGSLGSIVGQFKSVTAKRINALRGTAGCSFWQRSFYDHVIRNESDHDRVCEYIINNPLQWSLDEENPNCRRGGPLGRPCQTLFPEKQNL